MMVEVLHSEDNSDMELWSPVDLMEVVAVHKMVLMVTAVADSLTAKRNLDEAVLIVVRKVDIEMAGVDRMWVEGSVLILVSRLMVSSNLLSLVPGR